MRDIERTYTFEAPPDRVWPPLMDTKTLSMCIPGCESLVPDPSAEDRYIVKRSVKLAAVMGTYDGTVQLDDIQPAVAYSMLLKGRGRPGLVNGKAAIRLSAAGNATTLAVNGDVQAGG